MKIKETIIHHYHHWPDFQSMFYIIIIISASFFVFKMMIESLFKGIFAI